MAKTKAIPPFQSTLPALVRKLESNYIIGTTTISKYVSFNMLDTLNQIDAYINSQHISGETDSQGREKPFFNIGIAARNIWHRATDLDRKDIKIKATKGKDVIDAFLATVYLQNWMRKLNFGVFLNEWGRTLATYGSAVTKFVVNSMGLNCLNIPWNRLIVDAVDFEGNVKIEIIELTEAQLKQRKGYNKQIVENLISAIKTRETVDRKRKDNNNYYIKLYEVHGDLPVSYLTGDDEDANEYTQQMHVISFLAQKGNKDFDDFTLASGREDEDPYTITHLIKEDGRSLAIGAVEHLFQSQWMTNHTAKSIKDQLDLASKLIFQTSDGSFVGQNALSAIEHGQILIHAINQPLSTVPNQSHDIASLQSFSESWKELGNEITGISEAMLGKNPPADTAWHQTEAVLGESKMLFDIMKENKGLAIIDMMRNFILPYIKQKDMDNAEEIAATLESYDIQRIDSMYIKNVATNHINNHIIDTVLSGGQVSPDDQAAMTATAQGQVQDSLAQAPGRRFFSPSEVRGPTWKEQFKDLEDELEIDVTGEGEDTQAILTTLNTALQVVMNPAFAANKQAQFIVNRILEETAVLSPLQLQDMPQPSPIQQTPQAPGTASASGSGGAGTLPSNQ